MERDEYEALKHEAGFRERADRGLIAVQGTDRGEYLQGQLTNDVLALERGQGCYAAYLTPQGRMIADMVVLELGETTWLDVHHTVTDELVTRFEALVFVEDVRIANESGRWTSFEVTGPASGNRLAQALGSLGVELGAERLRSFALNQVTRPGDGGVVVARTDPLGTLGYDLWVGSEVSAKAPRALEEAGCVPVSATTAEILRIEHGRPAFPVDMDGTTIPLEAGIEDRAISFSKGCYVGQEVIIRVMHRGRGRVARRLVGLTLETDTGPGEGGAGPGAVLRREGQDVGRLTSVAWSPGLGRVVALGYVSRDDAEPDTRLEVVAPVGAVAATVVALPFS